MGRSFRQNHPFESQIKRLRSFVSLYLSCNVQESDRLLRIIAWQFRLTWDNILQDVNLLLIWERKPELPSVVFNQLAATIPTSVAVIAHGLSFTLLPSFLY
jgi:hypothetical protein